MTLGSLIEIFLDKEYDDKIYLTIIDKNKGSIVVENKRVCYSDVFEPYKDSYIYQVTELSEIYHYIVIIYKR